MPMPIAPDELDRLTTLRRDLHAHPELGFEETRTAAIVAAELRAAGLQVTTGIGRTGVVGALRVGDGGRRILLRADMDALAMPETAERPYMSKTPGKMHACGHDGHTTLLIGAARHLAATRAFSGTVHFVFQPAEEGRGGAKAMIADGFFEKFPVDAAYGLHNMPGLAPDQIAVVAGPQLASSDQWTVEFAGVGTHGAKPHLGRDAVTAAAQFVAALQTIPGRVVDPLQPAVVSACAFSAGDFAALNVIPGTVKVGGTARSYAPAVRDQLEAEIGRLAAGIAAAFGVTAAYRFRRGIPPVVNHPDATARALKAAIAAVGMENVLTGFPPSMAGDDFAEFAADVPGCYVWLGNGPAVDGALHHNSGYDFADAALPAGIAYWVKLVEQELAPGA
jgi:hippurate hydrolase